jgi:tungstate transport system permease protein
LNQILDGLLKAFQLIFSGDSRVIEVTIRSLYVSGIAAIIATLWGVPIAMLIGLKDFRGPLGLLGLLYTPTAIIIGEALLITPIIVSLATTAIEAVDPEIMNLAKTLGASESQASIAVLKEALNGIFLGGVASFNRAIAELGVALMIGGNIFGATEVLTTVISNETSKGDIPLAIALGIILLILVFIINLALNLIKRRKK